MLVFLNFYYLGIRYIIVLEIFFSLTNVVSEIFFPFKCIRKFDVGSVIAQTFRKFSFYYSFCEMEMENPQSKKWTSFFSVRCELVNKLKNDRSTQRRKSVSFLNLSEIELKYLPLLVDQCQQDGVLNIFRAPKLVASIHHGLRNMYVSKVITK